MIIKFRSAFGEEWILFDEVDYIRYCTLPPLSERQKERADYCSKQEVYFVDEKNDKKEIIRLNFINKNQLEETIVYAYAPIYLLNNEGKTIETIH